MLAEKLLGESCALGIEQDAIVFNVLIDAAARQSNLAAAEHWFSRTQDAGLAPDVVTFNTMIKAAARHGDLAAAERWRAKAADFGVDAALDTYNTLVDACAKVGDMTKAEAYFGSLVQAGLQPDIFSFGAVINGHAKRGNLAAAVAHFDEMERCGFRGSVIQFSQLLKACANAMPNSKSHELVVYAERLFRHMVSDRGISPNPITLQELRRIIGPRRIVELCSELSVDRDAILAADFHSGRQKLAISPTGTRGCRAKKR